MQDWLALLQPTNTSRPPQLLSAKGIDYRNLESLLAAGKWQEADQETGTKMCEVMGRQEEGWLDVEHIDNFPCEDLRTIDQLWVYYSKGHFGFSVQKRIYQSLGGTRNYDQKIWEAFGDRLGWRKENEWIYYNDCTFSEKSPEGHLPILRLLFGRTPFAVGVGLTWVRGLWWGCWLSLLSHRDL